jgi:hypothetical protein
MSGNEKPRDLLFDQDQHETENTKKTTKKKKITLKQSTTLAAKLIIPLSSTK